MKSVIQSAPGVQTTVALEDGALITGTTQDCTPYVERAKAMSNEGLTGSKDMRLAASIPFVIVERYLNDNGIGMQELGRSQEHQKRLLNDPALAHFRIWQGRV